jgi:hypothetical protein
MSGTRDQEPIHRKPGEGHFTGGTGNQECFGFEKISPDLLPLL